MIQTRQDLREYLRAEKPLYISANKKDRFLQRATSMPDVVLWKYMKLLRRTEFYYNNRKGKSLWAAWCSLRYLLCRNRKNRLGLKLGIEIWENSFEKGLRIYHGGDIVVNGDARIGQNCSLHGNNCIGNSGKSYDVPVIGDNVDIGVGAKIIGGVTIGSNTVIGAGAVVVKSFPQGGATLCGIPAKDISKKHLER